MLDVSKVLFEYMFGAQEKSTNKDKSLIMKIVCITVVVIPYLLRQ